MEKQTKKFKEIWGILVILATIATSAFALGVSMSRLEEKMLTRDEVEEIADGVAVQAAQTVIDDYRTEVASVDADDFVRGYIDVKEKMTISEYIDHCHSNKTRVFKGGILLIKNEYGTKDTTVGRYGEHIVNELINGLLKYMSI